MTQDSSMRNDISLEERPEKKRLFTSAMLHNGFYNIKDNLRLMIVLLVLHTSALPLMLLMLIRSLFVYGRADVDIYAAIAVMTTGAAVAGGILCALACLPYLYKRSVVDMRLSLPLTTGQRFISDYLSGLFIYFVPLLVSQILTWIVMLIGHITCDGRTFVETYADGTRREWVCVIFEEMAPYILKGVIGGMAVMLMFYALTVLIICCCGTVFESVMYTFMANGLIPAAFCLLIMAAVEKINGMSYEIYLLTIIPFTSPIGGVIGLVYAIDNEMSEQAAPWLPDFAGWIVPFILITLVIIACSYLIYRKRKAEDTGTPVVFGIFYHVIMTMTLVCIVLLFSMEDSFGIISAPMLILTAIVYMIFHVVRNRGFAHIVKGAVTYACTIAVCVGATALVDATGLFGAADRVPDSEDVSKLYVSYGGYFDNYASTILEGYGRRYEISDAENIAVIAAAHKNAIELAENGSGTSPYYGDRLSIVYKLDSGGYMFRDYPIYEEIRDLLSEIDMSEEMKQQRALTEKNELLEEIKAMENTAQQGYDQGTVKSVSLYPQWQIRTMALDNGVFVPLDELPEDFYSLLAECVYNDIMNETEEEYFSCEGGRWYFCGEGGKRLLIKESYTETIEYLKSAGFDEFPELSEEAAEKMTEMFEITLSSNEVANRVSGMQTPASTALKKSCGIVRTVYEGENCYVDISAKTDSYSPALYELLRGSYKVYKSDESRYTICVDGNTAVIASEYEDIAEWMYILSVTNEFLLRLQQEKYLAGESYDTSLLDPETNADSYSFDKASVRVYKIFLKAFLETFGEEKIDSITQIDGIYSQMAEYAA